MTEIKLMSILIKAVKRGMKVVRNAQLYSKLLNTKVKDNETIVTYVDQESELAIRDTLITLLDPKKFQIVGEEGSMWGNGAKKILVDPLDGTRAFSNGLVTSTVIISVLDESNKVTHAIVGEAISGRLWRSDQSMRVWQGELSKKQSTLFLDVSHGFEREGRKILNDNKTIQLMSNLADSYISPEVMVLCKQLPHQEVRMFAVALQQLLVDHGMSAEYY